MLVGRHDSSGVHHFGKAGTMAKKPQGDLRIMQFPNSLQQLASFGDALLRVVVAVSRISNRPAEKLEVSVPDDLEVAREQRNIDQGALTGGQN